MESSAAKDTCEGVWGLNPVQKAKNAQNKSLIVRSKTGNNIFTIIIYSCYFFADILYQRYWESCVDLRSESINTVIKQCLFRSTEIFERLPSMSLNRHCL